MDLYQAYAGLLVSAVVTIIAGSSSSLKTPKSLKNALKLDGTTEDEDDDDDDDDESERITTSDALYFPLLASVSLGTLFLAFKYLDKDMINKVMGYYFSVMGIGSLARSGIAGGRAVLSRSRWSKLDKWKVSLEKNSKLYTYSSFNIIHVVSLSLSISLTIFQQYFRHWSLANMTALIFSWNAITLVRLDSFTTGSVLLGGLFFYDIYWVFGSKVMVEVATQFDAPIKIQWPKGSGFSMLGLGDIVVPGVFIALALRFDYYLAVKRQNSSPFPSGRYPKPYFFSCLFSYIIGLMICIYVMHTYKAAQPALLYLSPLCTSSVIVCALVKGELKEFWEFDDGGSEEKKKEKEIEKKENFRETEEDRETSSTSTAVEEPELGTKRVLRSRASKNKL